MKHIIVAVVILGSIAATSCNRSITTEKTLQTLSGTWELRKRTSSMLPAVNYQPGNANVLKFTATGYEHYINGALVRTGTYTLTTDNTAEQNVCLTVQPGEFDQRIDYDTAAPNPKKFLNINGSILTFISGCFALDAGSKEEYERQ